jgi:hypothetical protein
MSHVFILETEEQRFEIVRVYGKFSHVGTLPKLPELNLGFYSYYL